MVGNGRLYAVAALGRELTRRGKSTVGPTSAGLTQIGWVVGPDYGCANLGFGWEVVAAVGGVLAPWSAERVIRPTPDSPFPGVTAVGNGLTLELTDVVLAEEPVLVRRLVVTRTSGPGATPVTLTLPVRSDPRNATFRHWNGEEVVRDDPLWRPSVPPEQLREVDAAARAVVLAAPARRLYQEKSSPYALDLRPRYLATSAAVEDGAGAVFAEHDGLRIELGPMAVGDRRTVVVWIVTANSQEAVVAGLQRWRERRVGEVIAAVADSSCTAQRLERIDSPSGAADDPIMHVLRACQDLTWAGQARCGGVVAQAYMYPMYYVRDQHGVLRLMLAAGEHERAYTLLTFYVAMQNRYGIQNAYDAVSGPLDPRAFDPLTDYGALDGEHAAAEVPSYVILLARDYLQATGDLDRIAPLYPRLAYNVRVQRFSSNGLLPSPGDESYTNVAPPRTRAEMTDSNLLFIAAARFVAALAETLGRSDDAVEFTGAADRTLGALRRRLWLEDRGYFAYARGEADDEASVDDRPALDSLLRWHWLEMGDPTDAIPRGCLAGVLEHLTGPIRIVPEKPLCAGMDPGYLLYATARAQHPRTHDVAAALLRYASDAGVFNEYYRYAGHRIEWDEQNGSLRPWESAINAAALHQYIVGVRPDVPGRRLSFQPHLPPGWSGWSIHNVPLGLEGSLAFSLARTSDGTVTFDLRRIGGASPFAMDVEFALFGDVLTSLAGGLHAIPGRTDLLRADGVTLPPGGHDGTPSIARFSFVAGSRVKGGA
ncbi:MAG TPA: hypothetical protein VK324_12270 [Tepidisphaeraceae bacterium]|nr:hypothetical protein [Tepidisphaeraceae bacterium]